MRTLQFKITSLILPAALSALLSVPLLFFLTRLALNHSAEIMGFLLRFRTLELVTNSLALILLVVVLATILAIPPAYLLGRRTFAGKPIVQTILALPLAVPGYIIAWSLLGLGGEQGLLSQFFGVAIPQFKGLWGASFAIALYTFPLLAVNLQHRFAELDLLQEQAARLLGKNRTERFWHLTLPQLWPAFKSGWTLIALYVLSDFGVPALMGFDVLASAIYTEVITSFHQAGAFVYSGLSLLFTLFLLFLLKPNPQPAPPRVALPHQQALRNPIATIWAWSISLASILPSLLVPAVALGHWLSLPSTWLNFLAYNQFLPSLSGTMFYSLTGSTLGAVIALVIALILRFGQGPLVRLPFRIIFLLYSMPGTALALCWAIFLLHLVSPLYQTSLSYIVAVGVLAGALSLGPILSSLISVSNLWLDGARLLGKSRSEVFSAILWPVLKKGVITGFFLSLGWVVRELPMAAILSPLGSRTLALSVFSHTSEANYAGAAPYALALVVLGLLFGLLSGLLRNRYVVNP